MPPHNCKAPLHTNGSVILFHQSSEVKSDRQTSSLADLQSTLVPDGARSLHQLPPLASGMKAGLFRSYTRRASPGNVASGHPGRSPGRLGRACSAAGMPAPASNCAHEKTSKALKPRRQSRAMPSHAEPVSQWSRRVASGILDIDLASHPPRCSCKVFHHRCYWHR